MRNNGRDGVMSEQEKSMIMKIKINAYPFLALFFPVIFTFLWLIKNNQLPIADATDYLSTAFSAYQQIKIDGILSGLWHFPRGFRPIFFANFGVPFLFLSDGNLFFTYQAVVLSSLIASGTYIYLLLRLTLDKLSAAIATNIVCLLPMVQGPLITFFAESALFPCVFGSIYHLIRADFFQHKKHTLGFIICFTLAILIRPIEGITHLFLIMLSFILFAWQQKKISFLNIVSVVALTISAAFLFFMFVGLHFIRHSPFQVIDGGFYDKKLTAMLFYVLDVSMLLMMLSWGVFALLKCNKKINNAIVPAPRSYFMTAFVVPLILILIWFLPYSFKTFLWIFRTSIGDIALSFNPPSHLPFWSGLEGFIYMESALVMVAALLIAIIGIIDLSAVKRRSILLSPLFIYLLLLVPFACWEVFNTIQNTPRKLSIAFPAVVLLLLLIGLQKGKSWLLRALLIAAVLIVQFVFAMQAVFPPEAQTFLATKKWLGHYPEVVTVTPNPHDLLLSFFTAKAQQYQLRHISIEVNVNASLPVDPFLLLLNASVTNQPYKISYPYFNAYTVSNPQKISQENDALFLSDIATRMVVSPEAARYYQAKYQTEFDPTLKTFYQLLYAYAKNELLQLGWQKVAYLELKGKDNNNYQGCLLLATNKKV